MQGLNRSAVHHVAGGTQGPTAPLFDFQRNFFYLLLPARTSDHVRPGFGQAQRNPMAQTGGSPRHNRNSPLQIKKLHNALLTYQLNSATLQDRLGIGHAQVSPSEKNSIM
jgi:hypothetical protein